ncbi:MAG: TetR/AcrR family transcriptional regulator [Spirochaetales bacterium]|nr:TetR/AcrR family transcriptional regulator [Spirochaetales bacterium]
MRPKINSSQNILDCASRLIREEGVESCTMRRLAAECGTAVGTLYNYFPSHSSLLEELFLSSWTQTIEKLSLIECPGAEEHICRFTALLDSEIRNRGGLGRFLRLNKEPEGNLSGYEQKILDRILPLLEEILHKSGKYLTYSSEELNISGKWLLIVLIDYIAEGSGDLSRLNKLIIHRFL